MLLKMHIKMLLRQLKRSCIKKNETSKEVSDKRCFPFRCDF